MLSVGGPNDGLRWTRPPGGPTTCLQNGTFCRGGLGIPILAPTCTVAPCEMLTVPTLAVARWI
eukprot:7166670-Prorocentrum_lima.AAC.1